MPPKRKDISTDEEPEEEYSSDASGSEYEEKPKPKAKKAPAKKAPAKRTPAKAKAPAAADEAGGSGSKPKAKRIKPPTEVTTLEDGWTLHPPSFIYKLNPAAQGGSKIACFDLDGTLVGVKSGMKFPKGPDDWKWFNKSVPKVVRELHEQGYQIMIISNQGSIKSALSGKASENVRGRVDQIIAELNKKGPEVPVQVFMATLDDNYRKPATGMWDFFVQNANKGVQPDLSQCFYVGDAAGRPTDINSGADSDRQMAANVGIAFFLPEDKFGEGDLKHEAATQGSSGANVPMATAFRQLADLFSGEAFKAAAYRKVANIIDAYETHITSAKDLAAIKGVGKSSLAKITEFLETGTLAALAEAGIEGGVAPVDKAAEVAMKFL